MSATATVDAHNVPLSRPDNGTIYLARRSELRLNKRSRYPVRGPSGEQVDLAPGEAFQFMDGRLYIPSEGDVTLADGVTKMAAQDARSWLDAHRLNGNIEDGFWPAVKVAPGVSKGEMDLVVNAALEFDEGTLEAIIETERAGWNREDFISSAEEALVKMRAAKQRLAEQQAEAQAEQKAAKPAAKQAPKAE